MCKATEKRDVDKLVASILQQNELISAAVCHGIKFEPTAVKKIEELYNITTTKCSIFASLTHPFLCSSPDHIIDNQTVLEVRYPYKPGKNSNTCDSTISKGNKWAVDSRVNLSQPMA